MRFTRIGLFGFYEPHEKDDASHIGRKFSLNMKPEKLIIFDVGDVLNITMAYSPALPG